MTHYSTEEKEQKFGHDLQRGDLVEILGSEDAWVIDSIEHEVDRWYLQLHQKDNKENILNTSQIEEK